MKTNAIVRIILFSLVIILLLGILAAGLGVGMYMFDFSFGNGDYIIGSGSVDASEVTNLEIEWAAGSILINTADVDTITFSESGHISEGQEMTYELSGSTLSIHHSKPAIQIGFFSSPKKDLTITIPIDWACARLSVDSAATDVNISNLTVDHVDFDSASGSCEFIDCDIKEMDIDTASGDIYYSGTLDTLDCDAASASVTAIFTGTPRDITMDGASGSLDITLPADNSGFTVNMDSISGEFQSDFDTKSKDGQYSYGNGACRIDIDGVSGDIRIRKGE